MKQKLTIVIMVLLGLTILPGFTRQAYSSYYAKNINTPYHMEQIPYWNGAACVQMILESENVNVSGRLSPSYPAGQSDDYIQEVLNLKMTLESVADSATYGWWATPSGIIATLDYYDTVGHYVQYADTDHMVSSKKLAWTIEHYGVPPMIVVKNGTRWMIVHGVVTSVAPTPNGTFGISAFRVHDTGMLSSDLGADVYMGYMNFALSYFNAVKSDTPTNPVKGKRVSICDPDVVTPELIVPPARTLGPLMSLAQALIAAQQAIADHGLNAIPGFEEALSGAIAQQPAEVKWLTGGNCYAVPYVKDDSLSAVVIVDGVDGRLMEASYALLSVTALESFYQELTYPFITTESSVFPGQSVPAPAISTQDSGQGSVIKINFQPEDAAVPYGYLADTGEPFGNRGNGHTYGWNMVTYETRERDSHTDQRFDTLNHMQKPSNQHATWEIVLQNGFYKVLVVCGDPNYRNQTNNIVVEDTILLDDDPWDGIGDTKGYDFDVWETLVKVVDGRLTIQPEDGAYNAKICFVRIIPTTLDLDEGLVAYWKCNEGEGTIAYDFSDTHNADLMGGASWAVGPLGFGGALAFNGENAYADTFEPASNFGIDGDSPRTVSAWVYTRSFNSGGVFEVGTQAPGEEFSLTTTIWDDQWRMQIWGGSPDYDTDFIYSSKDNWVHFAFVYDGARTKIYANAEREPLVDVERTLNTGEDKAFKIGRWGPYYFDGLIDEVRIYNRALSQAEIEQLMIQEEEGPRENVNFGNSTCPSAASPVSTKIDSENNAVELRCEGGSFNLYYIKPGPDTILGTGDDTECHIATCSYSMGENASQVQYDTNYEFVKITFWNYEGHINHEPSKPVADYVDNSFENRDTYIYYPASNTLKVKKELRALDSKGRSDPGKPWIPNFNKPNPSQQVADYCGQSPPNTLPDPCMASNGVYVTTLQFTGEIEGNGQIEIIINDVPVLVTTQPDTGVNELVQLLVQEFNNQWEEEPYSQQGKSASQDPNFLQIVQLRNVVPEEIEVRIIDEPNLQYNFYPYPHSNYTLGGDANEDGKINFIDFAIIAENWLVNCFETPWHPACAPSAQPIEIPRFE